MITEAHGAFADELVNDEGAGGGEALKFAGGDCGALGGGAAQHDEVADLESRLRKERSGI